MSKIFFLSFTIIVALGFWLTIQWLNGRSSFDNVWTYYDFDKNDLASFCEKTLWNKPVRQPVNTFSNIAYLLTAIFVLRKEWVEKKYGISDKLFYINRKYKLLLGYILVYVFCMGTLYHASLIDIALKFDYSGVYLIALFPMFYFSPRWSESYEAKWRLKQEGFNRLLFSSFFIIWLLLSIFIPGRTLSITAVVSIFIMSAVAFAIEKANRNAMGLKYLILSIVSVVVAFLCFESDRFKILCNPSSYLQPHALWNIFIGIAALFFYKYMNCKIEKQIQ
jgi:hypothetical protein